MATETVTDCSLEMCNFLLVIFLFLQIFPSSYLNLPLSDFILVFVSFFILLQILFCRNTISWTQFVEADMLMGVIHRLQVWPSHQFYTGIEKERLKD